MSNPINDVMVAAISRLGEIREHKGQRYVCTSVSPYTRRDGTQTTVLVWESQCAECGETFTFKTPNRERFEPNRRCHAHKKPGIVHRPDDHASEPEHAAARSRRRAA
jgi:hypothetical protein